MEFHTSEAILLDLFDLQEADRIVTFLTPTKGLVRGVAQGARRKYSRFAGELQPLAKLRVTWVEKRGRELMRISAAELMRPAHRLQRSLEGILLGTYLAGTMLEFAQENDPSDRLYRLLDSTLNALLEGVSPDLGARYFEAWILRLAGIFPTPAACPRCDRDLAEVGARLVDDEALLCPDCGRGRTVSPGAIRFLRATAHQSLPTMARQESAAGVLREIEELAGRIRRAFLGHELRSYRVLQETLCGPSKN